MRVTIIASSINLDDELNKQGVDVLSKKINDESALNSPFMDTMTNGAMTLLLSVAANMLTPLIKDILLKIKANKKGDVLIKIGGEPLGLNVETPESEIDDYVQNINHSI